MPRPLITSLILALLAAPPASGAVEPGSLEAGGLRRTYVVALPAQPKPGASLPLVVVLHGAGGNGLAALQKYRWDTRAEAGEFVAVAPDAEPALLDRPDNFLTNPRFWNDGSDRGPRGHRAVDDTAFIAALIDRLTARYPVDPRRIYATGFSSGASMTHLLGIELADRLAAIAPVAGKAWLKTAPRRPVPVLFLVGDKDPLTPLQGGAVRLPWGGTQQYPPARDLPKSWARLDRCAEPPEVTSPQAGLTLEAWRSCAGDAEVLFYTVAGLGHEWAGGAGRALPEPITGPYTDAVDTTAMITSFFDRHRLTPLSQAR